MDNLKGKWEEIVDNIFNADGNLSYYDMYNETINAFVDLEKRIIALEEKVTKNGR